MAGGLVALTASVRMAAPLPALFAASSGMENTPDCNGTPEITPVSGLKMSPV